MKKAEPANKRILLVINPHAGQIKSMTTLSDIMDVFGNSGYETTSFSTKGKADATDIVKKHAKNYDMIVCCGGDGTLNEVINGVMGLEKPLPIGYIPMGTSNDFATSLGLSTTPVDAAQDIIEGSLLAHDIGSFNNEFYFSYVASFGSLAEVAYLTPQKLKNVLGHSAYIVSGAKAFFKMRAWHAKVEYDGQCVEDDFILGGVSNSKSIAGMVKLKNKGIVLNDGIFELLFFRKPKNMKDIGNLFQWFLNQDPANKSVFFAQTTSATVTTDEFVPWTVDGEFAGFNKTVHIENVHNKINFLTHK